MSRIRIAKDKAELVKALTLGEDGKTGTFQTFADVMVFAAALGAKRSRRSPLTETSREPSPISSEVFISRGYDCVFKLLAVTETGNTQILAQPNLEAESDRIRIFEEYANGGLEILREELRGAVDYTDRILLIAMGDRTASEQPEKEFDLSRFLS
jgi:dnd system-associated protein 4